MQAFAHLATRQMQHYGCRTISTEELQRVVDKVEQQEASGSIQPLSEDETPTQILETPPEPGSIVSRREYPVLGAVELTLSNGMRVCVCWHTHSWILIPQRLSAHGHSMLLAYPNFPSVQLGSNLRLTWCLQDQ